MSRPTRTMLLCVGLGQSDVFVSKRSVSCPLEHFYPFHQNQSKSYLLSLFRYEPELCLSDSHFHERGLIGLGAMSNMAPNLVEIMRICAHAFWKESYIF